MKYEKTETIKEDCYQEMVIFAVEIMFYKVWGMDRCALVETLSNLFLILLTHTIHKIFTELMIILINRMFN